MKISTWMNIEHAMTIKQRWMVDGDERSMSPLYFSRNHSSPTSKCCWAAFVAPREASWFVVRGTVTAI